MFDGRWRTGVDRAVRPVGVFLVRAGASADLMTFSGLVFAVATAVVIANGWFPLAIVLLTLTGFHDALDGAVAKVAGTASIRGAFFDSVTDRLTDAIFLGGVAWYLSVHNGGRIVLLPFAILTVAYLISYERAKAESLGIPAKGGLMERAERTIILGVALLSHTFFIPVLWVMFALTTMTAMGRFLRVWRAASGKDEATRFAVKMTQATTAWREAHASGSRRPPREKATQTAKALGARRAARQARAAHDRHGGPTTN